MSDCTIKCPFVSGDNKYDVLINQLNREIAEIKKTATAKSLLYENKLNELCVYIKNNLSNELRLLFDAMKVSGELETLITESVLQDVKMHGLRLQSIVSVKEFGAQGNGRCDDTRVIQDALDYCLENKKVLYFPCGDYMVTKTLKVHRGNILRGEVSMFDNISSKLVLHSDKDIPLIEIGEGKTGAEIGGVKISGLYLVNNGYSDKPQENTKNVALKLNYTTEMIFDNLYVIGFNKAFELKNVTITTFRNVTTYYNNIVFDFEESSTTYFENSNIYESVTVFKNIGNVTVQNTHFESWVHFLVKDNNTYLLVPKFENCNIVSTKNETFVTATAPVHQMLFSNCYIRCNSINELFNTTVFCRFTIDRCVVFGIKTYIKSSGVGSILTIKGFKVDAGKYDGSGDKPVNVAGSAVVVYDFNDSVQRTNGGIELGFKRGDVVDGSQMYVDSATARPCFEDSLGNPHLLQYFDVGTTAERPTTQLNIGRQYFDSTLNKVIFWSGSKWVDAMGSNV